MEKKVYTEEDIEREVQERVEFKLNDIQSCIKNSLNRTKYGFYISGNRRITEESWTALKEMFRKETEMPVPYEEMYVERKRKQKNEFVDDVMEEFDRITRGMRIHPNQRHSFVKMLVSKIEKVQRDD